MALQSNDPHCNILDSLNSLLTSYENVVTRYYTPLYCNEVNNKPIDTHCVLFHSNRICLVTLAPNHPVIRDRKTIARINYVVDNVDRLQNSVRGKGKRGGQKLTSDSILCEILCTDESKYKVYSCVKGKLIEMNEMLIAKPNCLVTDPQTRGHVAVLFCDLASINNLKKRMLEKIV